jgi:uncharacterized membrane protein
MPRDIARKNVDFLEENDRPTARKEDQNKTTKTTMQELSQLTDQELLAEAKKMKKASIMSALLIGIMIGVVIWSVAQNTVGLFTLIPLYFIWKVVNGSNNNKELEEVLKERGLK